MLKHDGAEAFSNRDALIAITAFAALPQACERDEPLGTVALCHRMMSSKLASPKVWMNAYLAAFAIPGDMRLCSFDQDFKNFKSHGLVSDHLARVDVSR